MSAIAGRLNFDGAAIDPIYTVALGKVLARTGPHGEPNVHSLPGISMLYRPNYTTTEEKLVAQPFAQDAVVATLDGRLDNRRELAGLLGYDNERSVSDVELVARAYRRWGDHFCKKLLGDYALAIWDVSRRRLLLARDPFGVKTLYLSKTTDAIVWSSTAEGLLVDPIVGSGVSDLFVASYLSGSPTLGMSPFSSIDSIRPGSLVFIEGPQIEHTTFWDVRDCIGEIRYKNDTEYEDHFLSVLRDSISCRMRANGPILAEVSGGLDSSSVACLAHTIREETDRATDFLGTVSRIGVAWADEEHYIAAVEEQLQCTCYHLQEDGTTVFSPEVDERFIAYPTPLSFFPQRRRQVKLLSEHGAGVVLSGEFGDAIFRNDESFPVELSKAFWRCLSRQT